MRKMDAFSFMLLFINSIAFAGTVSLPQTGQKKCYDTSGVEISCTGTGQDSTREVIGAAADGTSEIIIQISNLPLNITSGSIEVTVANGDGTKKSDESVINGVFAQTYVSPEYFVRENHSGDISQRNREVSLNIIIEGQEIAPPQLVLIKPPLVLLHGIWSNPSTWDEFLIMLADSDYKYPSSMRKCNTWRNGPIGGTLGVYGKTIHAHQS